MLEKQRHLPAFPSAGKACKHISGNYAQKTVHCLEFQVAHIVKDCVPWELAHHLLPPVQQLTESSLVLWGS